MELGAALAGLLVAAAPGGSAPVVRWAVVSVASPCQVRFAGDSSGTRVRAALAPYVPAAGDTVALLRVGAEWWVLGKRSSI